MMDTIYMIVDIYMPLNQRLMILIYKTVDICISLDTGDWRPDIVVST